MPHYQSCLPCSLFVKPDSGFNCPSSATPADGPMTAVTSLSPPQRVSPPLPHCRIWELQPRGPKCSEFTDTVVTTSPFLLSPHKVLESRGSSSQHLQILHHSACALVALADIPSHGFSSQHTLWGPGPALSPPLSCQKGPAQPPLGLRDPTPPPLSRHKNRF